MLVLTRKRGESFLIGKDIELVITEISGDQVKIGIKAPAAYKILRKELVQTIENNRQAAVGLPKAEMRHFFTSLEHESGEKHSE